MAILPIVLYPDPLLKQKSLPVEKIDADVRQLLDDMLATMYDAGGIGLSAVQVGVLKRLVVVDVEQPDKGISVRPIKMVNPEIVDSSAEKNTYNEGCLSFPDQYSEVTRPKKVKIRYTDETGASQEIDADEMLATCVQHEIDHMDGIVFIDHISPLKRDMIARRMKKMHKHGFFQSCGHDHVHGEHCNH